MSKTLTQTKKGGDPAMTKNGNGAVKEVKLGRPPRIDRDGLILNNGFSRRQWDWFKLEAERKGMDTMALVRVAAQWWIDSVEADRAGPIATPEDDNKFDNFISRSKQTKHKKSKRST
jgi:hypothetical protein